MNNYDYIKSPYQVGYVPNRNSWMPKPVNKFKIKKSCKTLAEAERACKKFQKAIENNSNVDVVYLIWTKKKVIAQWKQCDLKIKEKQVEGAHKAAETR